MLDPEAALSRRSLGRWIGAGVAWSALGSLTIGRTAQAADSPPQATAPAAAKLPVRLSSNENPYGPPPAALAAMSAAMGSAARYPDESVRQLAAAVAARHGVEVSAVALGDGSSQILHAAAAAFAGAASPVVTADPTFEAIGHYAEVLGARVVRVPLTADHRHDLDTMSRAAGGSGLIYVCNPNNPTATLTPAGELRRWLDRLPPTVVVLVDEAYHDYASGTPGYESVAPWIARHPNLIVTRTFSKIFGMAGLRCGYTLAAPDMREQIARRIPWDALNVMASEGARAALGAGDWLARSRRLNDEARAETLAALAARGFAALPSCANFFMVDLGRDVGPVVTELRARGVRVGRRFPAMPRHLRVTVGTREEMRTFLDALDGAIAMRAA